MSQGQYLIYTVDRNGQEIRYNLSKEDALLIVKELVEAFDIDLDALKYAIKHYPVKESQQC